MFGSTGEITTRSNPATLMVRAGLFLLLTLQGTVHGQSTDEQNVLVIYSFHHDLPWQKSFRQGLLSGFKADGTRNYFEETLDSSRFPGDQHNAAFAHYLRDKYKHQPIDIILSESEPASLLLSNYDLFKDVPQLLVSPSESVKQGPNQILLAVPHDVVASFDAMLDVRKSDQIYVIAETFTPYLKEGLETLQLATESYTSLDIQYLVDLEMDQLITRVSEIPATANIFYYLIFQDGSGQNFIPKQVAELIVSKAKAPVFTHFDSMLGSGVVGGLVNSSLLAGNESAQIIKALQSDPSTSITQTQFHQHIYDQQALNRFNINASDLPSDSRIINQTPSIWTEYRYYVLGALLIILSLIALTLVLGSSVDQVAKSRRRLKESRRQLERAQSIAHIGNWQWVMDQKILKLSDETYRIYGLAPQNPPLSLEDILNFVHPDEKALVEYTTTRCFTHGEPIDIEYRITRTDGEERIVHLRGTMITNTPETATMEGTLHDVTEVRYLQNHLFTAQRLESIGRFAGGMAHHFNNLFTVMLGNSEILHAQLKDATQSIYIGNVIESIRTAAKMNTKLLAFSRNQSLRIANVDLSAHIDDLRNELAPMIEDRAELQFTVEDDLWSIPMDLEELRNSLINIVGNALEAMASKGQLVVALENALLDDEFVKHHAGSQSGEYVRISVSDTGTGMAADVHQRAFDPFFTTKDVGEGSGLGLSVVYGFVKLLNGYTLIETQPDGGTTVRMYFPRNGKKPEPASPGLKMVPEEGTTTS